MIHSDLPHLLLKSSQEILFLNIKLAVQQYLSCLPDCCCGGREEDGGSEVVEEGPAGNKECAAEYTTVNSKETLTATLTHSCSSLWAGWCLVALCRFSHCSNEGNIIFMLNPRLQVIRVSLPEKMFTRSHQ